MAGVWTIFSDGSILKYRSHNDCRLFGKTRKTEEQATKARDEMRIFNRLLAYRDEFDADFKEVWDGNTNNYYVYYCVSTGKYKFSANFIERGIDKVYMSKEVAKELVRKLNEGEVIL